MKMQIKQLGCFLILSLLSNFPSLAEVYKWTDDQGKVHYGDRPKNVKNAETVKVHSKPRVDKSQRKGQQKKEQLLEVLAEEREQKDTDQALLQKRKRERAKKCLESKESLEKYKQAGYLYKLDDQGERNVLSDDQYQGAIKNAEQAVKDWCT